MPLVEPELVEAIRKRPGMYVGDNGVLGLSHVISFPLDALCASSEIAGAQIHIRVAGRTVRIESDKPPAHWPDLRASLADPGLSTQMNWNGPWELVAAATLCSSFSIEVHAGNERVRSTGGRGKFVEGAPRESAACVIEFEPDAEIFAPGLQPDTNWIIKRAGELAAVHAGLRIQVSSTTNRQAAFCYPDGLADLLAERGGLSAFATWSASLQLETFRVDAALHFPYVGGTQRGWLSFANTVPTSRGGSHVRGLEAGLRAAAGQRYEIIRERTFGGISIQAPREKLSFAGPTKDLLSIPELEGQIAEALAPSIRLHLEASKWW
jgi:DNA gyrase subunit B